MIFGSWWAKKLLIWGLAVFQQQTWVMCCVLLYVVLCCVVIVCTDVSLKKKREDANEWGKIANRW